MLTLARALGRKPRLLLADELSLGLAPLVVDRLLQAVRQRRRRAGTAVIMVEQHAHKALSYTDHAIVMRRGRVAPRPHRRAGPRRGSARSSRPTSRAAGRRRGHHADRGERDRPTVRTARIGQHALRVGLLQRSYIRLEGSGDGQVQVTAVAPLILLGGACRDPRGRVTSPTTGTSAEAPAAATAPRSVENHGVAGQTTPWRRPSRRPELGRDPGCVKVDVSQLTSDKSMRDQRIRSIGPERVPHGHLQALEAGHPAGERVERDGGEGSRPPASSTPTARRSRRQCRSRCGCPARESRPWRAITFPWSEFEHDRAERRGLRRTSRTRRRWSSTCTCGAGREDGQSRLGPP